MLFVVFSSTTFVILSFHVLSNVLFVVKSNSKIHSLWLIPPPFYVLSSILSVMAAMLIYILQWKTYQKLRIFERIVIITVSLVNEVWAGRPGILVLSAGGDRLFFSRCANQCWAHPASCPVCTKGFFHGIKQPGHADDYSKELYRCRSTSHCPHFVSSHTIFERPLTLWRLTATTPNGHYA
jgi:phosphoglycerol transferase MdoB-like AlkP superfamily enzyme